MRAKHVLSHFNLRSRAKLVWSRITLSRLTTVYFAVAAIHCAIQIILQSQAFSVNASAANSLWTLIIKAGQSKEGEGFAILSDDLRLCYHLPRGSTAECSVIWTPNGTIAADRDPEYAVQISSADVDPLVTSTVQISSTQQLSSSASVQTGASNRVVNTAQATRVVSTSVVSSSSTARQIGTVSDVNNAQSALTSTATVTVVLSTAPPVATTRTITTSSSQRATPSSSSSTQQVKSTASSIIAFSQPPQSTAASVGVNAGTAGDDDNESVASDDSDDDDESDDDESDDKGVDGLRAFINKVTGSVGLAGARTQTSKRELSVVPGLNGTFTITDNSQTFDVSQTCIQALIYPVQKLSNTKREDITLIGFQFWVLTMSFVAILNESIPHLSAALVTQLLIAVWTAIQVTETESFRKEFFRLIVNGACHSPNLLGYYWQARIHAEIASAVLNGVAVLVTGIMTYKLFKVYSWQTYKRIGASLAINRIYKLVLCLSVAIQLALFFVVATAGLWIDQLYHGSVAHMSVHRTIYQSGVIVMACFLPPWLALGWFAMRREWRLWSLVFLTLNLAFLTMWGVQFNSNSFRWTLILWRFFSLMAVISGLLLLATLGLGLACRLNFGKGLPSYLNFQESVDGVDFAPVYPDLKDPEMGDYKEKIDFPSSGGSRSSDNFADQQTYGGYGNGYNAGYGSYTSQGTAPSYGSQGTDSRTEGVRSPERVAYPTHIRTRSGSTLTSLTPAALTRTDTQSSHVSQNSVSSLGSNTSNGRNAIGKRWVIE